MNSIMIVLLGIAGLAFGWFIYSRFVANHIYKLDPDFVTPAHELEDGVDYVPTNKYVLWGHHFTSVAGAAPIVGPAIAVYWGWVPAVLWVVFGSVFFAGVHDMGALWASNRHKGKSMGALSEDVIGKRTRSLFMIVVFLVLLMVNSVFGVIIANMFVNTPGAVFPAWSAIAVALVIGLLLKGKLNWALGIVILGLTIVGMTVGAFVLPGEAETPAVVWLFIVAVIIGCALWAKRGSRLGAFTVLGVVALYLAILLGSEMPLALPGPIPSLGVPATWIIILFVYAAIASMLPVWMLLQPRDFINGMQLAVGLILLYGAVLIAGPEITAPAFNSQAETGPSIIPLLFVTIACGAVSGFHGIVASGTSSKQLNKEPDARFVGYLAALGEGSLALITIVTVSGALLAVSPDAWHDLYHSFNQQGGAKPFVEGGADLIEAGWGLSAGVASTLLATMVALFAGTTMDSGVRLQRYIIQEWGDIYNISLFKNGLIATLLAVAACLALAFGAGGKEGTGGMVIWPLFGTTNQLLAGTTLMIISVMLIKMKRPASVTLLPMTFVLVMALIAALFTLKDFFLQSNWLLFGINLLVIGTSILVIMEALAVIKTERAKDKEAATA